MDLDFRGRVNNTKVPHGSGFDAVLEAVVNSIQAVDKKQDSPYIHIEMISNKQTLDDKAGTNITGFRIIDNGNGFTDENYYSFKKVDSTFKLSLGCKGIGRLSWLKVFSNVNVDSVYVQGNNKYRRQFSFNLDSEGVDGGDSPLRTDSPIQTVITMMGCQKQYLKGIQLGIKAIASRILEHCIAYFLHSQKMPEILVKYEEKTESVNDLFKRVEETTKTESVSYLDYKFDVVHARFKNITGKSGISFCANNLEVKTMEDFNIVTIDEDDHEFRYRCFVYSTLLDDKVYASRDGFDLGDKNRTIIDPDIPSIKEILDRIRPLCENYLDPYSSKYKSLCSGRLKSFVESDKGKMFSAVLKYDPTIVSSVTPNVSDEDLYRICSERQSKIEAEIIFHPKQKHGALPIDDSEAIDEQFKKITILQKDQLTKLVTHRGLILSTYAERLEAINRLYSNDSGQFEYELESVIHDLILPRGTDAKKQPVIDSCNLWILDERLYYYSFQGAYSDKRICDISTSISKLRPDIVLFGDIDDERVAKSICIIELKRPQRSDKNIIDQIYDYIDAIMKEKMTDYRGEPISITPSTSFYCYAICNISSQDMDNIAKRNHMKPQFGGRGYYMWNSDYNCSMDLIDHHRVFSDAKLRNEIFFSTIGFTVTSDAVIVEKGEKLTVKLNDEK